jgi:hypothetical protein
MDKAYIYVYIYKYIRGRTWGERARGGERRRTISRSLGFSVVFDLESRDGGASRDERDRFSARGGWPQIRS